MFPVGGGKKWWQTLRSPSEPQVTQHSTHSSSFILPANAVAIFIWSFKKGKRAANTPVTDVAHLLPPQRDRHQLPGHVHEMEGPLGHLPVGLGGEAGSFVHTLAHSNHICKGSVAQQRHTFRLSNSIMEPGRKAKSV